MIYLYERVILIKMNTIREKFNIIDESFLKTAVNVIRFFENEEREEMLQKLRMSVENRYIADIKLQKAEQISEKLSAQYGEDEANLQQMLEEYKQQVSQINPNVIGHKDLQNYDQKVEALLQAMAENDQQQNNGDEDIELMQGTVNVIDPITKKRMVDPMKNTCGHSYERESIIALLKNNKKMKCPVPGCRNKNSIEFSQLQPDIVLKAYLSQHPN